jgi:hypothetical protein
MGHISETETERERYERLRALKAAQRVLIQVPMRERDAEYWNRRAVADRAYEDEQIERAAARYAKQQAAQAEEQRRYEERMASGWRPADLEQLRRWPPLLPAPVVDVEIQHDSIMAAWRAERGTPWPGSAWLEECPPSELALGSTLLLPDAW